MCDSVLGIRIFSVREDREKHTVAWVTANVAINGALVFLYYAPNYCIVESLGGFVKELLPQVGFCILVLCNNQEPRCVFVYSVNQS